MPKLLPAVVPVAAVLLFHACGTAPAPATDQAPERIVTLNGTLTEIVAALGMGDRIVGVDVTSTWPPEVEALPKVGHDRNVRAEGVISLAPDLVLGGNWQMDPAVRAQLEQAGERVVLLPHDLSVDGTRTLIRQVADTLGRSTEAAPLIAAIDLDMAAMEALPAPPKVLFIYARGAGSLMVAGEGTPMHRMIELAGGRNAVQGFEQFKPLTPEALIAADPDAILMFDTGLDALQGPDGLLQVPGMAATAAGRNKAFITMDGGLLANFGPRLGQAAATLNAAFKAVPPRE
ncbi:MAG: ABC transporter substrate-binding protein [Flavobacteriales bacterium]|jgi:iron complex transport system substrate-binding protein|nr:ABC transporter substrate-binding protein [Flavobacteriales bacterium]